MYPPNSKKLTISLGPEAYVSQKLEKMFALTRRLCIQKLEKRNQNFAWTRSLCILTRKNSDVRLDPKLMYPKTSKKLKMSLDPEAYVSQKPDKYQNFAWTRSLCIPKPLKKSDFRLNPKLVYPEPPKKNQNFAWTRSLCIPKP